MSPIIHLPQVVETGAALTWAFFAFPTRHLDEKTPILQAGHPHHLTLSDMGTSHRLATGSQHCRHQCGLQPGLYIAAICNNVSSPVESAHELNQIPYTMRAAGMATRICLD